ncbi:MULTISPECIES: aminotransferase class IV [unclassified Saccharicrinis]|uniref:aminotransferase class IV n=1 Tax=unclassified Saccharicrinis TaxID=2646859 RepID=UPI003D3570A1
MPSKNNKAVDNSAIYIGKIPGEEALLAGDEIYEVFRVEDGLPLFLDDHLHRLEASFIKLGFKNHFQYTELKDAVKQIIQQNKLANTNIKISCLIDKKGACSKYIFSLPSIYPTPEMYSNGIQTILLEAERVDPNIKKGHTQVREMANSEIKKEHVFEALLVNHDGNITEGSRSNVFFMVGDTIYTAPSHIVLEGIMRMKVLELIQELGYKMKLECLHESQLASIDAAFITGTSPRILPIKRIGGHIIDVKHKMMRNLMTKLNEKIAAYKISADTQ